MNQLKYNSEADLPVIVPTARTAPLGWNPADLPGSWSTRGSREEDDLVHFINCQILNLKFFVIFRWCQAGHLDGLAPEGLMGVGVPEVNLSVLGAGDKLLHGGMDVQTPQLICVPLKQASVLAPHKPNDVRMLI